MAGQWFCQISGSHETIGPLSPQQLRLLVEQGKLSPDDLVRQGESVWVPAGRVKGLFASGSPLGGSDSTRSEPSAPRQSPLGVAPPVAVPVNVPPGQPVAVPIACAASEPPPVTEFRVVIDDQRSGKSPPSASPVGARKQTGNPKLVAWLLALLAVSSLGVAAVLFWPRSALEEPAGSPLAEKTTKPAEELDVVAPLENLEDLTDDVAVPSADESPETQWTDAATESIRRGDVSVRILSAQIGRPRLVRATGRAARPTEDVLVLKVQLRNESETRKLEYAGWGSGKSASAVKLTDDFGNPYLPKTWKGATVEGQLAGQSLYPGKSLEDILVFEEPVDKAKALQLRLPASVFGEKETLDFAIPTSMITVTEDASASPPVASTQAKTDEPLPPGRGVPAIEQGTAEMDTGKPAKEEPESIMDIVNKDTEALGGGDQEKAAEADFEEMLRDRKDLDPARRDGKPQKKSAPRKSE